MFSRLAGRSVQISSTRLLGIDTRLEPSGSSSLVMDSASSTISHIIRLTQPERCIALRTNRYQIGIDTDLATFWQFLSMKLSAWCDMTLGKGNSTLYKNSCHVGTSDKSHEMS